jgi:hypothetical protein
MKSSGNFCIIFDFKKIGAFLTFTHSGHHTNIQMKVERYYPRGEGVLYERSRKLTWHSQETNSMATLCAPAQSAPLSPSHRKHVLWVTLKEPVCFCFGND